MSTPTRLKKLTTKNTPAVREALLKVLPDVFGGGFHAEETEEGLVVNHDSKTYHILVGYDKAGKTVYTAVRYKTELEKAQDDAETWNADRILEVTLKTAGSIESAEESLEATWQEMAQNRSVYSIQYYASKVAKKAGYLELVREIHTRVEYEKNENPEITAIDLVKKIQADLHETVFKFAQYGTPMSHDFEAEAKVEKSRLAAEWSNQLKWQLKSYEKAQQKLAELKKEA